MLDCERTMPVTQTDRSLAKPLLDVLAGAARMPPPLWLMRQAGRYLPEYRAQRSAAGSFLDLVYDPVRAAEVTLQPIRRFGLDAAILFSDILVVPHAMGQNLTFVEGEGPRLQPVRSARDLTSLAMVDPDRALAPIYETVGRVRAALPPETALIGFAGAPWTVACYMVEGGGSRDFVEVRRFAYTDPQAFSALIDRLVVVTGDYLCRQVRAGAEVIQIFDSWAGVLSPAAFARWVVEPTRQLVSRLRQDAPGTPVIGFPRGCGAHLNAYVQATGVGAVSLDTNQPLPWARQSLAPATVLQGNLDPVVLMLGGAGLDAEIDAILETMSGVPFIFNLGHGVLPETPPDHVGHVVDRVRNWQKER